MVDCSGIQMEHIKNPRPSGREAVRKQLAYCHTCERPQVVNIHHKPANGQRSCGLCGKASIILSLLLLMGLTYPALTTGCTWVGWDSIQACNAFAFNVSYVFSNTTIVNNINNITNITAGQTNTIEVFAILALIMAILFFAAEFADMPVLGVFSALLLLLSGLFILTNGIVYKVGEIQGGSNLALMGGSSNLSGNFTALNQTTYTALNTTNTNLYAKLTVGGADFGGILGLVLVCLGMFAMLTYALKVGRSLNRSS